MLLDLTRVNYAQMFSREHPGRLVLELLASSDIHVIDGQVRYEAVSGCLLEVSGSNCTVVRDRNARGETPTQMALCTQVSTHLTVTVGALGSYGLHLMQPLGGNSWRLSVSGQPDTMELSIDIPDFNRVGQPPSKARTLWERLQDE